MPGTEVSGVSRVDGVEGGEYLPPPVSDRPEAFSASSAAFEADRWGERWGGRTRGAVPTREAERTLARPSEDDERRRLYQLMGSGFEFATSVGGGALLGFFLDRWLGTKPWLLLIGVCLGFAGGLVRLVLILQQQQVEEKRRRSEKSKQPPQSS